MEIYVILGILGGAVTAALAVFLVMRAGAAKGGAADEQVARMVAEMASAQAQLAGRLSQLAETSATAQGQLGERMQAQERAITKTLEERLADLTRRVGDTLQQNTTKTAESMSDLKQRLAVIDAAQKNITELSGQMVGLHDILSNKQARGAFGEVQLQDIVQSALPPSAYAFQVTLGNGKRADCLIRLPDPPGPLVVDAKFPLESYRLLTEGGDDAARAAAARRFGNDVMVHVKHISERYIVAGETAESALMFLPSEAVYAELHANFPDVVRKSYEARVWIVSPTTLMATLNTVRAVLKDAHMREQADVIQKEVRTMLQDLVRLDDRVANLQKHFDQAGDDIRQIRISTDKVARRGERIGELELGDEGEAALSGEVGDAGGGAEIRRLTPGG
jgi:DNA recombination protein RmuC